MKGSRPTLEDTRCTVCSRFIPRGYTARLSNGSVQCLTHPFRYVSIDKGSMATPLPPTGSDKPPTRRRQVMAAVQEQRALHMEIL